MERKPTFRRSALHCIPLELVELILSNLDCIDTLHRAILVCRLLYEVFSSRPLLITNRIIAAQLGSWDAYPEAAAALRASQLPEVTLESLPLFYDDHFRERNVEPSISFTFDEAASVSRLHSVISRMTEDFAKTRFQDPPRARRQDGDTAHLLEPSRAEKSRVMRALYIIEVFLNLFRGISEVSVENKLATINFFKNFAHWEVEQIACAHYFLYSRIYPIFNDMAEHDVCWGASQIQPADWIGEWPLQSFLFKGLVAVEKLAETKTYGERYELFDHGQPPVRRNYDLYGILYRLPINVGQGQFLDFEFESPQSYSSAFWPPYFDDPDDGAFKAWEWACQGNYTKNRETLYKWGFAMWDRARLGTLSSLMSPGDVRRQSRRWGQRGGPIFSQDDPIREIKDETWASSWERRAAIYEEGGEGWWDFGNESNIVWPRGRKEPAKTDSSAPAPLGEVSRIIAGSQ